MYSSWGVKNVSHFEQSLPNSVNQEKCLIKPKTMNKQNHIPSDPVSVTSTELFNNPNVGLEQIFVSFQIPRKTQNI